LSSIGDFWEWARNRIPAQRLTEIRLPFVRAVQLPGLRRWRLFTRLEPRGPWLESIFMSGSRREMELRVADWNARAQKRHNQREKLKKWRAQQEVHAQGGGKGKHTLGPAAKCPVCNEQFWNQNKRDRTRREEP
jgi:hypothetical protein